VKHISESDSRTDIPGCSQPLSLLIKTLLQNAPKRDADKLERLLKVKRRQKEEAMQMEDIQQRSVIERLKC
jgi:hypothetical protein